MEEDTWVADAAVLDQIPLPRRAKETRDGEYVMLGA